MRKKGKACLKSHTQAANARMAHLQFSNILLYLNEEGPALALSALYNCHRTMLRTRRRETSSSMCCLPRDSGGCCHVISTGGKSLETHEIFPPSRSRSRSRTSPNHGHQTCQKSTTHLLCPRAEGKGLASILQLAESRCIIMHPHVHLIPPARIKLHMGRNPLPNYG